MTEAPVAPLDPFAEIRRGITEPDPVRPALRATGPIVRAEAPAGGPVWIVTEAGLARQACTDPRIVKDPAFAPGHWGRWAAGLEPPAAEQPSLTTVDGAPHTRLRRAHAPLFSARRVLGHAARIEEIARDLLGRLAREEQPVDLLADFSMRFPLTVICDLIGVPAARLDETMAACQAIVSGSPEGFATAVACFTGLAEDALPGGIATELRDRLADPGELGYHLLGLVFAGQVTTEVAVGFLLARVLAGEPVDEGLVQDVLRTSPPAPFTLWRFTSTEVELGGVRLPARAPVLVDIEGINTAGADAPELTFGVGPHYCVGAALARLELRTAADVLRADFPAARLAVPYERLEQAGGGLIGRRLTALPVWLRE